MFRKLKQWLVGIGIGIARSHAKDRLNSNQPVKDAIHLANKALQSRFTMEGDGRQKAVEYAHDLMLIANAYVDAFGDPATPASISNEELAAINEKWDEIVDRYVPASRISEWLDAAFDYADDLIKKSI